MWGGLVLLSFCSLGHAFAPNKYTKQLFVEKSDQPNVVSVSMDLIRNMAGALVEPSKVYSLMGGEDGLVKRGAVQSAVPGAPSMSSDLHDLSSYDRDQQRAELSRIRAEHLEALVDQVGASESFLPAAVSHYVGPSYTESDQVGIRHRQHVALLALPAAGEIGYNRSSVGVPPAQSYVDVVVMCGGCGGLRTPANLSIPRESFNASAVELAFEDGSATAVDDYVLPPPESTTLVWQYGDNDTKVVRVWLRSYDPYPAPFELTDFAHTPSVVRRLRGVLTREFRVRLVNARNATLATAGGADVLTVYLQPAAAGLCFADAQLFVTDRDDVARVALDCRYCRELGVNVSLTMRPMAWGSTTESGWDFAQTDYHVAFSGPSDLSVSYPGFQRQSVEVRLFAQRQRRSNRTLRLVAVPYGYAVHGTSPVHVPLLTNSTFIIIYPTQYCYFGKEINATRPRYTCGDDEVSVERYQQLRTDFGRLAQIYSRIPAINVTANPFRANMTCGDIGAFFGVANSNAQSVNFTEEAVAVVSQSCSRLRDPAFLYNTSAQYVCTPYNHTELMNVTNPMDNSTAEELVTMERLNCSWRDTTTEIDYSQTAIWWLPLWCHMWGTCQVAHSCVNDTETRAICSCPYDYTDPACATKVPFECDALLTSPRPLKTRVCNPLWQRIKDVQEVQSSWLPRADGAPSALPAHRVATSFVRALPSPLSGPLTTFEPNPYAAVYRDDLDGDPPCYVSAPPPSATRLNLSVDCRFSVPVQEGPAAQYAAQGFVWDADAAGGFAYAALRRAYDDPARIVFASTPPPLAELSVQLYNMHTLSDRSKAFRVALNASAFSTPGEESSGGMVAFDATALSRDFTRGGRIYFETAWAVTPAGLSNPHVTGQLLEVYGYQIPRADRRRLSVGGIVLVLLVLALLGWFCVCFYRQRQRDLAKMVRDREQAQALLSAESYREQEHGLSVERRHGSAGMEHYVRKNTRIGEEGAGPAGPAFAWGSSSGAGHGGPASASASASASGTAWPGSSDEPRGSTSTSTTTVHGLSSEQELDAADGDREERP